MYPAQELYSHHSIDERIISTDFSVKLVHKFCDYCKARNIPIRKTGELIGLKGDGVTRYRTKGMMPYIETYLRMRRLVGYQVGARDINYAYAMVKYPPAEIKRRLKRIARYGALTRCAEELGLHYSNLCETVNYTKHRSVLSYWRLMTWIAAQERERKYDDALKFYK